MQRRFYWLALALMVLSVAGPAPADEATASRHCFSMPTSIPGNDPTGVTTILNVDSDCGPIKDLDLFVQISHTWVGDVEVRLTKENGPTAFVIDRPGVPASFFGCSGDDYEVTINDEAATGVEDECGSGVPSIQGELIGGDPTGPVMAVFEGEEFCGEWQLNATDNFGGGDIGTLFEWCLIPGPDDGTDDAVPASSGIGVAMMLVLLMGFSAYFMCRRVPKVEP